MCTGACCSFCFHLLMVHSLARSLLPGRSTPRPCWAWRVGIANSLLRAQPRFCYPSGDHDRIGGKRTILTGIVLPFPQLRWRLPSQLTSAINVLFVIGVDGPSQRQLLSMVVRWRKDGRGEVCWYLPFPWQGDYAPILSGLARVHRLPDAVSAAHCGPSRQP